MTTIWWVLGGAAAGAVCMGLVVIALRQWAEHQAFRDFWRS